MSVGSSIPPADDSWVVAIHESSAGGVPLAAGVVIDERRILTCAHVVVRSDVKREALWIAFPFADPAEGVWR